MVLPEVLATAGNATLPSTSISHPAPVSGFPGGLGSLVQSRAGVAASVPLPSMGQIGAETDSKDTNPLLRFVAQLRLCQFGGLSLRTPKFEPPTISR